MTIEGCSGSDHELLSYDVKQTRRSVAVEVCRIVFGRIRSDGAEGRKHMKEGFIHRPGVVWIGQSVLALPSRDAKELSRKLRRLGVRVRSTRVPFTRAALDAFRR
jgi:hypothetical protein